MKVGPNCPLTVVLDNPPSHLAAVGPNEELGFGWFGMLGEYSMKFPGKPIVKMPWNDLGLNFFPSSKGDIPVGFAFSITNGRMVEFPAAYAEDGSYIPLTELCPELNAKMVRLDEQYQSRYGYAKNGYLALGMTGEIHNAPNENSANDPRAPSTISKRITKTYILQEIR